ncbi:hypothetical protein KIPB_016035, partial [Kipferlia bialata]
NDRYVNNQVDTWVVNPGSTGPLSAHILCSGTTQQDADYVSVYSGLCELGTVVSQTLLDKQSGTLSIEESLLFPPSEDPTGTKTSCLVVRFETDSDGTGYDGFECQYFLDPPTTSVVVTDESGTLTNDRYLANQSDTYSVFPSAVIASTTLSIE